MPVIVDPAKLRPVARERTIAKFISPFDAAIVREGFAIRLRRRWVRPTRTSPIRKRDLPNDLGMNLMFAIELNAAPVDEVIALAGRAPRRRDAKGVRIEHHPVPPARNAARSRIEPHGDALVSKVVRPAGDFIRVR